MDPDPSRRQFLGAAAAVAALPTTAPIDVDGVEDDLEESPTADESGYSVTDCGSVSGGPCEVHVQTSPFDGPIAVTGIREPGGWSGVGLRWTAGPFELRSGLDPDDARDLATRLDRAADAAEGSIDGS